MKPCEVAVIGAGIVGAATAWELHARGIDVALLDRGEVSAATTGLGEGNVLCSDKGVGPELELTLAGLGVYDELEERLGAGPASAARGRSSSIARRDVGRRGGARGGPARAGAQGHLWTSAGAGDGARAHGRARRRVVLPGRPAMRAARHRPCARGGLPRVHTGVEVHAIAVDDGG